MPGGPRRLLCVTTEPPPTSSGLGTFWAKLVMGAVQADVLAMEFLGPEPDLASNHGDSGLPAPTRLHGLGRPPLSRLASIGRNTGPRLSRLGWSAVRAPFTLLERLAGRSLFDEWVLERVSVRLPRILEAESFDMVLVKAPPLDLAERVFRIVSQRGVPFGFFMGEPVERRNEAGGLDAGNTGLQQELVDASSVFVTTREAYERYHRDRLSIDPAKVVFVRDSFVPIGRLDEREARRPVSAGSLLHWGHVAPWRPVDTLASALVSWNRGGELRRADAAATTAAAAPGGCGGRSAPAEGRGRRDRMGLTVMGHVVDGRARRLLRRELGPLLETRPRLPYLEARAVARTARRFVVVTSPRHRDNIPSKLIDALAYGRPILLLAHPDSAAAEAVTRLGVGAVGDVRDGASVLRALRDLEEGERRYEAAFREGAVAEEFHFERIGARFREGLLRAMGW